MTNVLANIGAGNPHALIKAGTAIPMELMSNPSKISASMHKNATRNCHGPSFWVSSVVSVLDDMAVSSPWSMSASPIKTRREKNPV